MRFPAPSPSPSPSLSPYSGVAEEILSRSSDPPLQFSPPLIAMVVVLAAAFLFVTYSRLISRRFLSPLFRRFRRWRHRRRRLLHLSSASTSSSDLRSFSPFPFDSFHYSSYSPYGLDESVIKTLPLFLYSAASCAGGKSLSPAAAATGKTPVDCAVCLLEFEEGDYVRTLPLCFHAFHLECIDEWLRSHPNCPLCRTAILRSGVVASTSPFVPLMAPRIRPSLDDGAEESNAIVVRSEAPPPRSSDLNATATVAARDDHQEITAAAEERSPAISRFRELKRSYSFDYDREGSASERATVSPWRYRRSTWSKQRQSPFGNLISKSRVFSLRYHHHRSAKSPFSRRRSGVFFPISERIPATGSSSSRRTKSMTSPRFFRTAPHSSSRLRFGDPEALLSPERWRRRDTCRVDM